MRYAFYVMALLAVFSLTGRLQVDIVRPCNGLAIANFHQFFSPQRNRILALEKKSCFVGIVCTFSFFRRDNQLAFLQGPPTKGVPKSPFVPVSIFKTQVSVRLIV